MTLLKLFTKKKEEPVKREEVAPSREAMLLRKSVDELLEAARGPDAVYLWDVSYQTSIEYVFGEIVEGTTLQVFKYIASRPGAMKSYSARIINTPKVLR